MQWKYICSLILMCCIVASFANDRPKRSFGKIKDFILSKFLRRNESQQAYKLYRLPGFNQILIKPIPKNASRKLPVLKNENPNDKIKAFAEVNNLLKLGTLNQKPDEIMKGVFYQISTNVAIPKQIIIPPKVNEVKDKVEATFVSKNNPNTVVIISDTAPKLPQYNKTRLEQVPSMDLNPKTFATFEEVIVAQPPVYDEEMIKYSTIPKSENLVRGVVKIYDLPVKARPLKLIKETLKLPTVIPQFTSLVQKSNYIPSSTSGLQTIVTISESPVIVRETGIYNRIREEEISTPPILVASSKTKRFWQDFVGSNKSNSTPFLFKSVAVDRDKVNYTNKTVNVDNLPIYLFIPDNIVTKARLPNDKIYTIPSTLNITKIETKYRNESGFENIVANQEESTLSLLINNNTTQTPTAPINILRNQSKFSELPLFFNNNKTKETAIDRGDIPETPSSQVDENDNGKDSEESVTTPIKASNFSTNTKDLNEIIRSEIHVNVNVLNNRTLLNPIVNNNVDFKVVSNKNISFIPNPNTEDCVSLDTGLKDIIHLPLPLKTKMDLELQSNIFNEITNASNKAVQKATYIKELHENNKQSTNTNEKQIESNAPIKHNHTYQKTIKDSKTDSSVSNTDLKFENTSRINLGKVVKSKLNVRNKILSPILNEGFKNNDTSNSENNDKFNTEAKSHQKDVSPVVIDKKEDFPETFVINNTKMITVLNATDSSKIILSKYDTQDLDTNKNITLNSPESEAKDTSHINPLHPALFSNESKIINTSVLDTVESTTTNVNNMTDANKFHETKDIDSKNGTDIKKSPSARLKKYKNKSIFTSDARKSFKNIAQKLIQNDIRRKFKPLITSNRSSSINLVESLPEKVIQNDIRRKFKPLITSNRSSSINLVESLPDLKLDEELSHSGKNANSTNVFTKSEADLKGMNNNITEFYNSSNNTEKLNEFTDTSKKEELKQNINRTLYGNRKRPTIALSVDTTKSKINVNKTSTFLNQYKALNQNLKSRFKTDNPRKVAGITFGTRIKKPITAVKTREEIEKHDIYALNPVRRAAINRLIGKNETSNISKNMTNTDSSIIPEKISHLNNSVDLQTEKIININRSKRDASRIYRIPNQYLYVPPINVDIPPPVSSGANSQEDSHKTDDILSYLRKDANGSNPIIFINGNSNVFREDSKSNISDIYIRLSR